MYTGETDADLATIELPIFDADGLPASGEAGEGAVYAVAAGELKVRANGGAWGVPTNYALTHLGDGIYSFKFAAAEIIKGKIDVRAKKIGTIRTQVVTVEVVDAPASSASAATIADAVWDEARAGHVAAGSFGEGVKVYSVANDAIGLDSFDDIAKTVVTKWLTYGTVLAAPAPTRTTFRISGGAITDKVFEGGLAVIVEGTGSTERWFGTVKTFAGATLDAVLEGTGFPGIPDNTSVIAFFAATVAPVVDFTPVLDAVANVQADTDDIQTRLPAALIGGRIEATIGDVEAFGAYQIQGAVAIATVIPTAATSNTISFKYKGPLNTAAETDIDANTLVGMTITLHNPNLTRDEAPQTRRISAGAYDGGTNTYTATVTPAWTPVPVGTFGDDGGDYIARLWPASTDLATTQDVADIIADVDGVSADVGAVQTDVDAIQVDLDQVLLNQDVLLGLLHHNSVVDKQTWSGTDLLTARIRRFASAAATTAATRDAADNADNEIRRFQLVAEYASAGKVRRFQITEINPL